MASINPGTTKFAALFLGLMILIAAVFHIFVVLSAGEAREQAANRRILKKEAQAGEPGLPATPSYLPAHLTRQGGTAGAKKTDAPILWDALSHTPAGTIVISGYLSAAGDRLYRDAPGGESGGGNRDALGVFLRIKSWRGDSPPVSNQPVERITVRGDFSPSPPGSDSAAGILENVRIPL